MTEREVKEAVETTIERCEISIKTAQDVMLNGPIQGGIYRDLRKSRSRYGSI